MGKTSRRQKPKTPAHQMSPRSDIGTFFARSAATQEDEGPAAQAEMDCNGGPPDTAQPDPRLSPVARHPSVPAAAISRPDSPADPPGTRSPDEDTLCHIQPADHEANHGGHLPHLVCWPSSYCSSPQLEELSEGLELIPQRPLHPIGDDMSPQDSPAPSPEAPQPHGVPSPSQPACMQAPQDSSQQETPVTTVSSSIPTGALNAGQKHLHPRTNHSPVLTTVKVGGPSSLPGVPPLHCSPQGTVMPYLLQQPAPISPSQELLTSNRNPPQKGPFSWNDHKRNPPQKGPFSWNDHRDGWDGHSHGPFRDLLGHLRPIKPADVQQQGRRGILRREGVSYLQRLSLKELGLRLLSPH